MRRESGATVHISLTTGPTVHNYPIRRPAQEIQTDDRQVPVRSKAHPVTLIPGFPLVIHESAHRPTHRYTQMIGTARTVEDRLEHDGERG